MKTLKELCTPAFVYLTISIFTLIVIVIQNIIQNGEFCVGQLSCPSSNMMKTIIFSIEVIYILFWTWLLTLICKSGYKNIAWAIVLFPFVLIFLLLCLFILQGNKQMQMIQV